MRWLPLVALFLTGVFSVACVPVDKPATAAQNDADYHYLMGSSYLKEGKSTQALQEFLSAEKLDGQRTEIHAGLAQAYMAKRAYELAEKHYLKALELSSGAPDYYNNLGALYLSMGRFEDSAAAFQKAADNLLFSSPEIAWAGMGYAYFNMNNYTVAERAYKRAIEFNPGYVQSYFRLGELYYAQDRPVEAVEAFATAARIVPGFVEAHYRLGLTYMKIRKVDEARQAFQAVIRLSPESEQAKMAASHLKVLQ